MNESGLKLLKHFEGKRLKSYRCSANVSTIGYGHTKGVKDGDTCTEEQADAWLLEDLYEAEKVVKNNVKVPLNSNQHAALTCFVFNVGAGNFINSTLLKLLNRGWYEQVPAQLNRWNKSGGEVLGGLARRREEEGKLWNS